MDTSPIHILFVSDHLGHEGGRIHGATRYFLDVLPQLEKSAAVELHVVFLRRYHKMAQLLEEQGVEVTFLQRAKYDPRAVLDIVQRIRNDQIAILHCAGMKGILSGRIAARITGIPCIAHLHDMLPPPVPIRQMMRLTRHWSELTLAISNAVAQFAAAYFKTPPATISVLRNGVHLSPFCVPTSPAKRLKLRKQLGIPEDATVIISVGRLHAVKGFSDSINVLRHIRNPKIWLLIVGEGPEEKHLREQAQGLPVVFAGQRSDIPDLLTLAAVMLMPSYSEGLGLSAMESLAAGVPVVAYATGGLKEVVVHNTCGILVPKGDLTALCEATRELIFDKEKNQQFACEARRRSASFAIDQHIEKLLDLYRNIFRAFCDTRSANTDAKHKQET